jgi:hypothetical protein
MASNCANSNKASTQTSQILYAPREENDLEPKLSLGFAVFPAMSSLEASITLFRFNAKVLRLPRSLYLLESGVRHPRYELPRHVMVFSNIDVVLVGLRPGLVL